MAKVEIQDLSTNRVILSEADFAQRENVSRRTVMRWRTTGEGPPFIRIGARRIGYKLADVEAWESARTFAHRADEISGSKKEAA